MPDKQQLSYKEQLRMEEQILNENTDISKINDKINDQSLLDLENEVKQM